MNPCNSNDDTHNVMRPSDVENGGNLRNEAAAPQQPRAQSSAVANMLSMLRESTDREYLSALAEIRQRRSCLNQIREISSQFAHENPLSTSTSAEPQSSPTLAGHGGVPAAPSSIRGPPGIDITSIERAGRPHVATFEEIFAKFHDELAYEGNNTVDNSMISDVTCPVCLEKIHKIQATTTKCGHIFCYLCIRRAIKMWARCPMCNRNHSIYELSRMQL